MTKEFIPYEQALELKELGFDEECLGWYRRNEVTIVSAGWLSEIEFQTNFDKNGKDNFYEEQCTAPLFQQAFRFFREKHKIWVSISEHSFCFELVDTLPAWFHGFKSYEESQLACLKKLIEIIKNK